VTTNDGLFKGFVGIFERKKKILAFASHYRIIFILCPDHFHFGFCHRTIYLHIILMYEKPATIPIINTALAFSVEGSPHPVVHRCIIINHPHLFPIP